MLLVFSSLTFADSQSLIHNFSFPGHKTDSALLINKWFCQNFSTIRSEVFSTLAFNLTVSAAGKQATYYIINYSGNAPVQTQIWDSVVINPPAGGIGVTYNASLNNKTYPIGRYAACIVSAGTDTANFRIFEADTVLDSTTDEFYDSSRQSATDLFYWLYGYNTTSGGVTTYTPNFTSLGYNTTNNTLPQLINFSCGNNLSNLWFGNTNPPTNYTVQNKFYGNYTLDSTIINQNLIYYYIAGCNGSANSSVYSFRYDNIQPTINFASNNQIDFNLNNSFFFNQSNILLNFSIGDNIGFFGYGALEVLFSNNTNFDSTSNIYYNYTNSSITGLGMNYSSIFNANKSGYVYVRIMVADVHNPKSISYGVPMDKDLYKIIKEQKKLNFETIENNVIDLTTSDDMKLDVIRTLDNYKFNMTINKDIFGNLPTKITFILKSKNIEYIKDSTKKGHFIITNDNNIFNKNFVDFENEYGLIPKVKEKKELFGFGDKYYEISFDLSGQKELIFNSIGGVNVNTITGMFYINEHKIKSTTINPESFAIKEQNINFFAAVINSIGNNTTLEYQIFKNNKINTSILNRSIIPDSLELIYVWNAINNSVGDNFTMSVRSNFNNNYTSWQNTTLTKIVSLIVDDCTASNNTIINFTSYDEKYLIIQNLTRIDANFLYSYDNISYYNYSVHKDNLPLFRICVYPDNTTILLSGYMQYELGKVERYYLENSYIVGSSSGGRNVFIYNFNDTTNLIDMAGNGYNYYYQAYNGIIAKLQRYYPGLNSWLSVQNDKLDVDGMFLFYVTQNIVDYRILWEKDGIEIARTDKIKFLCPLGVTPCTQSFLIIPTDSATTKYSGVNQYGVFDNVTKMYTFTWTDSNNLVSSVRLKVNNFNAAGNTTVCDQKISSSSGSINCNLSGQNGLISILAIRTASPGDPFYSEIINLLSTNLKDIITQKGYTKDLNLMFFFVSLGVAGLSVASPVIGVISLVGVIYLIFWLNLFTWLSLGFVITFGLLGLLVSYALRK